MLTELSNKLKKYLTPIFKEPTKVCSEDIENLSIDIIAAVMSFMILVIFNLIVGSTLLFTIVFTLIAIVVVTYLKNIKLYNRIIKFIYTTLKSKGESK